MIMKRIIEERLTTSQAITLERAIHVAKGLSTAFRQNRLALFALFILSIFSLVAFFEPWLAPYDPMAIQYSDDGVPKIMEPPSSDHVMGTTHLGRDVFSQWVHGARISLLVGLIAGVSVMIIGSSVGLTAGYYRGLTDLIVMRIVDILYSIPSIPLVLVIALILSSSTWVVVIAMIAVLWRTEARVIRAQTLSLAERPFVKSARATGASDFRIIFVHIAPNVLPIIIIEGVLVTGNAILLEASVAFLGIGSAETMSWGAMLQLVLTSGGLREAWWWVLPPGLSIALVVVSLFYVSRGIEDYTNPDLKKV